jgi:hypothetical protein
VHYICSPVKSPQYPLERRLGWLRRGGEEKKLLAPAGNGTPVIHPVAQSLYWLIDQWRTSIRHEMSTEPQQITARVIKSATPQVFRPTPQTDTQTHNAIALLCYLSIHNFACRSYSAQDPTINKPIYCLSEQSMWPSILRRCLGPLEHWDRWFEYRSWHGYVRVLDSSVSIMTMLWAGRPKFDSWQGQRLSLFATTSRPTLGVQRPRSEADDSPPSSAKMELYSHSPYIFMAWSLIKRQISSCMVLNWA